MLSKSKLAMDCLSREQRSRNMAAVKGKDTKPELRARSAIHKAGFRYALHRSDLPGKPDLVLPKHTTVVFVHGCFWHGHECAKGKRPATNTQFWEDKLSRNVKRDQKNQRSLIEKGWKVFVIWECTFEKDLSRVLSHLKSLRGLATRKVTRRT